MGVSLSKGGNISLSKEVPGLEAIKIGCGWDAQALSGAAFDLDASIFLCGADGKVTKEADFVFYGNLQGAGGAVVHAGDSRTGEGGGDDELIMVSLKNMPPELVKAAVVVTIHEAVSRGQNFGMVENAYIRIINAVNDAEIARYDLTEDYSGETAVIFGEVYLKSGEWKFKAVGQGSTEGLAQICAKFGVSAS
ncbi:TerD family protein [Desulfobulbus sp. F5]|nr:TerD family protein [Desulfobulbus sp. F5]